MGGGSSAVPSAPALLAGSWPAQALWPGRLAEGAPLGCAHATCGGRVTGDNSAGGIDVLEPTAVLNSRSADPGPDATSCTSGRCRTSTNRYGREDGLAARRVAPSAPDPRRPSSEPLLPTPTPQLVEFLPLRRGQRTPQILDGLRDLSDRLTAQPRARDLCPTP